MTEPLSLIPTKGIEPETEASEPARPRTGRSSANALNALASTGPRTLAGKAASSRNATRHGLTSKLLLAPGETARDFDQFSSAMSASLTPVGQLEAELVNRAVVSAWRLRRIARLEASYAQMQCEQSNRAQERYGGNEGLSAQAVEGATVANRAKVLVTLTRYEAAIERSMYRALHEVERVQAYRAGQSVRFCTLTSASSTR